MAATTRTSTGVGCSRPTGVTSFSWRTRSRRSCTSGGTSATSSRKIVPPSAAWKRPSLSSTAPVNAPFRCPKSSDSTRPWERAAQFTGTKGPRDRVDSSWIAWATSSFPVPVSPMTSTVVSVSATRRIAANTSCIGGERPTIPPGFSGEPSPATGRRSRRSRTLALSTSGSTGLVRTSSTPVWRASTADSTVPYPVTMRIGAPSPRVRRTSAIRMPSRPGMRRSMRIRSNRSERSASTASCPSAAATTSWPSSRSSSPVERRNARSSSTSRIRPVTLRLPRPRPGAPRS